MGFKGPQSLESWSEIYLDIPTVPWVDNDLVERVRKYNKSLPLHWDISSKYKENFRFRLYTSIRRAQYLALRFRGTKNKKERLLRYLKRKIGKKEIKKT